MTSLARDRLDSRAAQPPPVRVAKPWLTGVTEQTVRSDRTVEIEELHRFIARRHIPAARLEPRERRFKQVIAHLHGECPALDPASDLIGHRIFRGQPPLG